MLEAKDMQAKFFWKFAQISLFCTVNRLSLAIFEAIKMGRNLRLGIYD